MLAGQGSSGARKTAFLSPHATVNGWRSEQFPHFPMRVTSASEPGGANLKHSIR